MHKKLEKRGFTIIELIVVMAVLAILVLIATPKLLGFTQEAKETQIRHDLRVVKNAIEEYLAKHNELPEALKIEDVEEFLLSHKIYDANGLVSSFEVGDEARVVSEVEVASLDGGVFMSGDSGDIELYDVSLMDEVKAIKTKIKGKFISNNEGKVYNAQSLNDNDDNDNAKPHIPDVEPFIKTVGGSNMDYLESVINTKDGGYVTVGYSVSTNGDLAGLSRGGNDAVIAKFDTNGNKEWLNSIGGGSMDNFYSVAEASDGGYIAVGESMSDNGDLSGLYKGGTDAIIVKFDAVGNKEWIKTIGSSGLDYFYSVIATKDGGYIAAGYSNSTNGDLSRLNKGGADAIIVKFDSSGNKEWIETIGGSSHDSFYSVIEIINGFIVVGHSNSTNGDLSGLNKGNQDGIIVKFGINGEKEWVKTVGGNSHDYIYSVIEASDGGYIAVGESNSKDGDLIGINKGNIDALMFKLDANGDVEWITTIGGSNHDYFYSVIETSIGGYIAVGKSISTNGDLAGLNKGRDDAIIVKISPNGNKEWVKAIGGSGDDVFKSVIESSSGGYTAVGNSNSRNDDLNGLYKGSQDGIIVKLDYYGNLTKEY